MNTVPGPRVAEMVHYVSRGSADGVYPATCRAAVITEADHGVVSVAVFNPSGIHFAGARHDEGEEGNWYRGDSSRFTPGTWHRLDECSPG